MDTQVSRTSLGQKEISMQANWMARLAWFAALLVCYIAVFILGSNYFNVFPTNHNMTYNLATSTVFLVAALWLRRSERWNKYWRMAFAFFMASVMYPATSLLAGEYQSLLGRLNIPINTTQGIALDKLFSVIVMVIPILVLNKLSGADLGSIFMKRGNMRWGLSVGWLVWVFLATSAPLFSAMRFTGMGTLAAAILWGLVFSFANGFMEELWIRGIFLKRFEPVLGMGGSILLAAVIYAMLHSFAVYLPPIAVVFYVLNTLALGIACGYLMMKTDSIWGPALIHAAADLVLFVATLAIA